MSLVSDLTGIADAIREKTGKTDKMLLAEMPEEIAGISGGVGVDLGAFDLEFISNKYVGYASVLGAIRNGIYCKDQNAIDFFIPKEKFNFGDKKWSVQFRFEKNSNCDSQYATILGPQDNGVRQLIIEFRLDKHIAAYLQFEKDTSSISIFESELLADFDKFYAIKIDYDGAESYTTVLYDSNWNELEKNVYTSSTKAFYEGRNEFVGTCYQATDNFQFYGKIDLKNSYISHNDKIVWGAKSVPQLQTDYPVFIGGCPETKDNEYQAFSDLTYVNNALNFSDASKPICLQTGTYRFFGKMSEQSGHASPNKSTLVFRINGKDIETFTVPNHSNGGKLDYDFEVKLSAGDWFGFYKEGTDGWSTVTNLTIECKGIKVPIHYFLYIQPDYSDVPEVTYAGPTITTTNPTEVES